MIDFIQNDSRDPYQYIEYSGSLLGFTNTIENNMIVPKTHLKLLEYLSKHVCDGIRLEEGVILSSVIENNEININTIDTFVQSTVLLMCLTTNVGDSPTTCTMLYLGG